MAENTGINGVLLTNIIKINGVTVAGSSKNVAGAILNFGESGTSGSSGTSGTGGGGGGTAYSVRLYGDPRSGGGFRDSGTACMAGINGFPVNNGNDLYLDGFDSNLGQVTIFFDVALTTPFPDLKDPLYYYVECLSDSRLDKITLLSQQDSSDGWVYLNGPC
jgi:hypothetical protein